MPTRSRSTAMSIKPALTAALAGLALTAAAHAAAHTGATATLSARSSVASADTTPPTARVVLHARAFPERRTTGPRVHSYHFFVDPQRRSAGSADTATHAAQPVRRVSIEAPSPRRGLTLSAPRASQRQAAAQPTPRVQRTGLRSR